MRRCSYKSGREAAKTVLEEANTRDMTKLLNKTLATRRPSPRNTGALSPIRARSPLPKSTPSKPQPRTPTEARSDQQETDTTALVSDNKDTGEVEGEGDDEEAEAETEPQSIDVNDDTPLNEADEEEPVTKEAMAERKDDKEDASVPNSNDDTKHTPRTGE